MMKIIELDDKTIEQIAAGEVIESPVSIIKELVENSIDAKAKNIIVEIKNGGKSYIRVTDDGIGIDEDDFERAFKRHATSKIKDFSDLYRIFSLGFRGEALSSIISCADVKAVSKTKNQDIGKKLEFKNGKLESINSIATNNGTSIEVFNLFSNLPVRRKFLGSDINESNKISKIIQALALGYDNISFKFIKDNRLVFQTLESDSLKDRIFKLIDDNLKDNLIKIRSKNSLYDISGYISSTNYYRGNRSFQYIFVNNRLIENINITKTVENNYKSLIPNQRFPVFFLFIATNTSNIDVNIHPNKKEIKFTYEDSLLELLDDDISKFLYDNSDFKKVKAPEEDKEELNFYDDYTEVLNLYNKVNEEKNSYEQEFHDDRSYNNVDDNFFEVEELNFIEEKDDEKLEYKNIEKNKKKQLINIKNLLYKTSIFNRYSLFINSDKIILLDHRRADQRIKFDEFIENFNKDKINSQQLLEAKIIKVSLEEYNKYLEKKEIFKKLGFEIDTFSFDKLIIRSVPIVFDNPENLEFFYNLLDIDDSNESLFKEKISSLINKNTFRKGDKIDESEALATLNKLNKSENPYKTYDGKSTIITIEENELEKYFDR
ncbi:MAG: DNA mismatch repair endonuclease MutL [Anaerococcus hydrogenalis]|uniref:DNA mismatch repair endonuclease MutL n=1 Tax=Anaerococcus hydrogenalis TaxID=33029 RepID=UPI00290969E8|nr:DNA mismatch repair endonuclease MutL [Anaerococcus hydrogenalis]MDU3688656.1 DNA mismatch repair endonuclease MutL [Anaerococcus hydrogenalis]